MSLRGVKPVSELSKLIQQPAVFQWSTEKRLSDISVALLLVAGGVPSDSRAIVERTAEQVFDNALKILLPGG